MRNRAKERKLRKRSKPQAGDVTHRKTPLFLPHGGYKRLKSFQIAQLVYDLTVYFVGRYIPRNARTVDQMVQAARSGVQNIAEGSQASGTSKKTELKLTNVARASFEELKLDYGDFLRQRGFFKREAGDPRPAALVAARCSSLDEVRDWVNSLHDAGHGPRAVPMDDVDGMDGMDGGAGQCPYTVRPPSPPSPPSPSTMSPRPASRKALPRPFVSAPGARRASASPRDGEA